MTRPRDESYTSEAFRRTTVINDPRPMIAIARLHFKEVLWDVPAHAVKLARHLGAIPDPDRSWHIYARMSRTIYLS